MKALRLPWLPFTVLSACSLISFVSLRFLRTMECKKIRWVSASSFFPKESFLNEMVTYYLMLMASVALLPFIPCLIIKYCVSRHGNTVASVFDTFVMLLINNLLSFAQIVFSGFIAHQKITVDPLWGFNLVKSEIFHLPTPDAPKMLQIQATISLISRDTLDCHLLYNQRNNWILVGIYVVFVVFLAWDTLKFFWDVWVDLGLKFSYHRRLDRNKAARNEEGGADGERNVREIGKPDFFFF